MRYLVTFRNLCPEWCDGICIHGTITKSVPIYHCSHKIWMFEMFSFCWYRLKALGVITYRIFDVLYYKIFKLFGSNSYFWSLCQCWLLVRALSPPYTERSASVVAVSLVGLVGPIPGSFLYYNLPVWICSHGWWNELQIFELSPVCLCHFGCRVPDDTPIFDVRAN